MLATVERLATFYNWGPSLPVPQPERPVDYEPVTLTTVDGERLYARFHPGEPPASAGGCGGSEVTGPRSLPRPAVLFCHGNCGTLRRWRNIPARWRAAVGADVLTFNYRGYGRSTGRPTEAGLYADGHAALAYLKSRAAGPALIVGQSLGGAVAVELATTAGCDALILESTFTGIADVPRRWPGGSWLAARMRNSFASVEKLAGFDRPLFVSHGTWDPLIPHAHADRLADVAAGPTKVLKIPGMGHSDRRGRNYEDEIAQFIERYRRR